MAATVAFLAVGAAHASNVNVATLNHQLDRHLIAEVAIGGPGGGVFLYFDPMTGPDLTDPDSALDAALAALGLPGSTLLGPVSSTVVGTDSTIEVIVDTGGAVEGDDYIILGDDPADYGNWIALTDEAVNVRVDRTTTSYTFYRLQATIMPDAPAPVHLPAAGLLLIGGLGGLAALRRRT